MFLPSSYMEILSLAPQSAITSRWGNLEKIIKSLDALSRWVTTWLVFV